MAEKPQTLRVIYSRMADRDLLSIWEWNAGTYSVRHADEYRIFLKSKADELGASRTLAKPVLGRPQYRYITIRRSRRGYGHVAVFRITDHAVEILRFFHTAEDWPNKL